MGGNAFTFTGEESMNKKRIKKSLDLKKNWPGYVLLAPAVIAVFTLSIYPLFRGIYLRDRKSVV